MLANLANLAVWLLVAASVVMVGWSEPLKYQFMSPEKVEAEEKALFPPPPPATPLPDYRSWNQNQKKHLPGPLEHPTPFGSKGPLSH